MTLPAKVAKYANADRKFREDLRHYCSKLVKIQGKDGKLVPFVWNEGQVELHKRLERQLDARGLVRALILKARQLGCSTYIGARYYQKTSLWRGRRAFILTHEDKATQQLFSMTSRIHANMPVDYRLSTEIANANELAFEDTNSSYRIGTARNTQGTGRSLTLQLFHGSEVAFWAPAEVHFAAVLQAVPLIPGTEVILETTGNGVGGTFYDQWGLAERGLSDFIAIFLPWYIDPSYSRQLTTGYEPSQEELKYQRLYKLNDEQICWLHFKNIELGGEPGKLCSLFKQEYPATAAEAFQASSGNSLIGDEYILAARRNKAADQSFLPRVIGMDVARSTKDARDKHGKLLKRDATRIVDRQGRKAGTIDEAYWSDDPVFLASRLMKLLVDNPDIRKAFVDVTEGMGAAIVSICRSNGFEDRVAGVNFGSSAQEENLYPNRRCEMAGRARDWFKDPGGADIPDNDLAHRHIAASQYKHDANSRLVLEPKADIKSRLGFSPDWFDALILTFAEILSIDMPDKKPKWAEGLGDDDEPIDFITR
jgi:hypothetical protein